MSNKNAQGALGNGQNLMSRDVFDRIISGPLYLDTMSLYFDLYDFAYGYVAK